MAFNEIELARIDKLVGSLCRKIPEHVRHELRHTYVVEGHSVMMFEERPGWDDPSEWTQMGIAKFRYFRSRGEWKLYWMRRDLKWHEYDPEVSKSRSLEKLVKIVEEDKWGAFYG